MGQPQVKSLSPIACSTRGFHWVFRLHEFRPADRKSAGASGALEAPVIIGGPSRTRTLDPLIKSQPRISIQPRPSTSEWRDFSPPSESWVPNPRLRYNPTRYCKPSSALRFQGPPKLL